MKLSQFVPVVPLILFPLAPASVEELPQPVQSGPEAVSGQEQLMCGRCGDLYCAKQCGETAMSCPMDCGTAN